MRKIVMVTSLLLVLIAMPKAVAQTGEELFQKGLQLEEVKGELEKAIDVYKNIISVYVPNKQLVAKSLLHLGKCYEKLGKSEARKAYERVVREFADQNELVAEARVRLAAHLAPEPLPEAPR
jgi:tetratricopeptide (TPR) repeat protein